MSSTSGKASKETPEVPDLTRLRNPGFSARRHRSERCRAVLGDYVDATQPNLDAAEREREIERLFEELQTAHPWALREFLNTAPSSRAPQPRQRALVEVAAMRSLPQAQELEKLLRSGNRGRPGNRQLPLAIFECNAWVCCPKQVRCHHQSFLGSNQELDWAFGYPVGRYGETARGQSATYSTLNNMLERHDPLALIDLNIAVLRQLHQRHPEMLRYCAIDGTRIPASAEQRAEISKSEATLLRRGLDARFLYHENGTHWRGWTQLTLTDLGSTLPVISLALPLEHGREFQGVTLLLDLLFERWPDCPLQFLVGDSEYDVAEVSEELVFRYGVQPVFAKRQLMARKYEWAKTQGSPHCSKHGVMKLVQAENFFGPKQRAVRGIPEGEIPRQHYKARMRWQCSDSKCPVRETTYPHHNPRLYTYLPEGSEHRRSGLRQALMRRRNQAESINFSLKHCGVGLGGTSVPRWVSSKKQADWLVGAAMFGLSLRRLAYESGAVQDKLAEAQQLGLIKDGGCRGVSGGAGAKSGMQTLVQTDGDV